jgi:hypothetical protein
LLRKIVSANLVVEGLVERSVEGVGEWVVVVALGSIALGRMVVLVVLVMVGSLVVLRLRVVLGLVVGDTLGVGHVGRMVIEPQTADQSAPAHRSAAWWQ